MRKNFITIKGARTHNLKNINLDIPKNKLVVVTGVSGSGKSSLVFDTIYSEGQRRYIDSLSTYARQFLGVMDKPDVESIEGISPAIAIDQKSVSSNPRSTVGTITEIYDYLRLLFAHTGKPHCPHCDTLIQASTQEEIIKNIKKLQGTVTILAPLVFSRKGQHKDILEEVGSAGFMRVRLDGRIMSISEALDKEIDPKKQHSVDVAVDKLKIDKDLDNIRLTDSVETALKMGKGALSVTISPENGSKEEERMFSEKFACERCGFAMPEPEPRTFSFNSPYGACSTCSGIGHKKEIDPELVMPNKDLSLAEGAIHPWMTASHRVGRQGWYWRVLHGMSDKYDIDMHAPVGEFSERDINIILYGDEEYEGVAPNLERRYKETDSDYTRAEIEKYMKIRQCPSCEGRRLKPESLSVKLPEDSSGNGVNIDEVVNLSVEKALEFFENFPGKAPLTKSEEKIAAPIVKEIRARLSFLSRVGLGYLTLAREAGTLSGGESQRIRLATQLGSRLSGVFYILDEPSIGLHARDQARLLNTIKELRDLGNTVLVVEHDPMTIEEADYVIDIGPGAGKNGGKVTFKGTPAQLKKSNTLTAKYMKGEMQVDGHIDTKSKGSRGKTTSNPANRRTTEGPNSGSVKPKKQKYLTVKGAAHNNLKNIEAKFPLSNLICVTGVSGSGKSSLINSILASALQRELHGAHSIPGEHKKIEGMGALNKSILIDQSPIGKTPRSNPATYTNLFTPIRELFAASPEARARGYKPGRFSFNVKGGRCEKCRGGGVNRVEMFMLSDIYVECDECAGKRYNKDVLEVTYRGKSIYDVLNMTVEEASDFFKNIPSVKDKLDVLNRVGLGYIELGQPAPSLSGGEAQRVKLATELARKSTGKTLYILDEPTVGLHADDINKLLNVIKGLVAQGNTVIVIEHNMDIIKNAGHIVDLGPEGGERGGYIVAEGTPRQVSSIKKSYTGQYLRQFL